MIKALFIYIVYNLSKALYLYYKRELEVGFQAAVGDSYLL
jgi:hypothetical protein